MKRAQAQPTPAYAGPLQKFDGRYRPDEFDSLAWTRKRYEEMPRRLAFHQSLAAYIHGNAAVFPNLNAEVNYLGQFVQEQVPPV